MILDGTSIQDFYSIVWREEEEKSLSIWTDDEIDMLFKSYLQRGKFWTFKEGCGKVLCIFGFLPLWKGTAECVYLGSNVIGLQKIKLVKQLKGTIDIYNTFSRLQTSVRAANKQACKFVEVLGFKRESLAEKYINNEDYYWYTIIK